MKYLVVILILLMATACSTKTTTPDMPPVEPTPVPTPTVGVPSEATWPKLGPVESAQIFHFSDLKNFKKKLRPGVNLVTLELDQIEMPEAQGGVVAHAHAQGTLVVCYTSQGWEEWRSDANLFPKDAMGKVMEDWSDERWGDPRKDSWLAFMETRIKRCKATGADAIELDNMNQNEVVKESGIKITKEENIAAQKRVADLAHAHGLAILAKNGTSTAEALAPIFDGIYVESCSNYDECEEYMPFKGKPVVMLQYKLSRCRPFDGAICYKKGGYFHD